MRWDDAAGDHTGTFPLAIEDFDEDEDDEDDEAGDEEPESIYEISIVSRWDLEVVDVPALIEGGRAAHRRLQPEESEEDAVVAIADDDIGPALYALVHESGEPWYDFPGVFVLGGHRVYIDRDGDQPMTAADEDDDLPELAPFVSLTARWSTAKVGSRSTRRGSVEIERIQIGPGRTRADQTEPERITSSDHAERQVATSVFTSPRAA